MRHLELAITAKTVKEAVSKIKAYLVVGSTKDKSVFQTPNCYSTVCDAILSGKKVNQSKHYLGLIGFPSEKTVFHAVIVDDAGKMIVNTDSSYAHRTLKNGLYVHEKDDGKKMAFLPHQLKYTVRIDNLMLDVEHARRTKQVAYTSSGKANPQMQHQYGPNQPTHGPQPTYPKVHDNGDGASEQRAPEIEIREAGKDALRKANPEWVVSAARRLRRVYALTDDNFKQLPASDRQKYLEVHPWSELWSKTGNKQKQKKLQEKGLRKA